MQQLSTSPPASIMRRLIRSKETLFFLMKDGTWTQNIGFAEHFTDPAAVEAKRLFGLEGVEIYYSFQGTEKSQYDFAVPF